MGEALPSLVRDLKQHGQCSHMNTGTDTDDIQ